MGLEHLEALVKALGLPARRSGDAVVAEYPDPELGRVGVVVAYDEQSGTVRIAVPTDVEPFSEALPWFLEENFTSPTYKYALDPEGFVVILWDLPERCIRTVRDLREALLEVLEGARRLYRRVERGESTESGGGGDEVR